MNVADELEMVTRSWSAWSAPALIDLAKRAAAHIRAVEKVRDEVMHGNAELNDRIRRIRNLCEFGS